MKFSVIFNLVLISTAMIPAMALNVPLSDLEKRLATGQFTFCFSAFLFSCALLPAGPNAQRMARGLGPLPPTRRRPVGMSLIIPNANCMY